MPAPQRYEILPKSGPLLKDLTEDAVIALCREGRIVSAAMANKLSTWGINNSGYKPIRSFPEFAPHVHDVPLSAAQKAELYPPSDAECHLFMNGQQHGPFLPTQIRSMWDSGSITSDALYFYSGLPDWRPVKGFCQNAKPETAQSNESQLLKQLVTEQQKTSSHLWRIRVILIAVIVIPLLLSQCSGMKW